MRRPLAIAVSALVLTACSHGTLEPPYHRPALPVPPAFPTEAPYAQQAPGARPASWQSVFTGPKLQRLITLALAQNRDLRSAVAQTEASRAQFHAQRAALFPTVNGTASAQYGQEYINLPPQLGINPDFSITEYQLGLGTTSYQVDLFGKIRSQTRAAFEQYVATREGQLNVEITVAANVAADWLTMAGDESLLEVSRETLDAGQQSLNLTQSRLANGVGTGLDVAQAQTIVQQARADIGRYETQVAQDLDALQLAVGAPIPVELRPTDLDDPSAALPVIPGALQSSVLLRRPDVLQAEDQLRSANANIGAARAAFFPSISLTGSVGTASASLAQLFAPPTMIWQFTPTVTLPIFTGGLNRANLAYAKAEDRLAVAQYEKAIQTAFREVADALAVQGRIDERIAAQQGLVAASAESLRLSTALYERGEDTYLDVLTAQRTLFVAQQALISLQVLAKTNIVTLYQVLGGGFA
ncbi:MAG TPA: efflux transporter outer membrane subunit [Caulobacteraceae bacterium]|nr:efflux transporter outer membrane subunit [Caulobacteraceae bacterium]